jgi:hypothetical protein
MTRPEIVACRAKLSIVELLVGDDFTPAHLPSIRRLLAEAICAIAPLGDTAIERISVSPDQGAGMSDGSRQSSVRGSAGSSTRRT